MNSNDFVSIDNLLGDLTTAINDESFNKGIDKGWYVSRIHRAIQDTAIITFYDTQTKDIINWYNGSDLSYPIPLNCFNIKEIYLFNGECSENKNSDSSMVKVHWKVTYRNNGESKKISQSINKNHKDTVDSGYGVIRHHFSNNTFYGNIQNGLIMLSPSCTRYKNIRLVYNGMGVEEGDFPSIPRIMYKAIYDKVKMEACEALKFRYQEYRYHYEDSKLEYYGNGRTVTGSKKELERVLKSLDAWKRRSYHDYLQNPDFR